MMPEERSEGVLALFELQETLPAESYIILDLYARSMVESYIILYLLRRKLFQYFCLLHYDIVFPCYLLLHIDITFNSIDKGHRSCFCILLALSLHCNIGSIILILLMNSLS